MPKSMEEINAEKDAKPRVDKIPGVALNAIGDVKAYGLCKHGDCTWKKAGTEQADPQTHVASASRHMSDVFDDLWSVDAATGLLNMAHLGAQICIALDCMRRADPARFDAIRATLPATLLRLQAELEAAKAEAKVFAAVFPARAIEGEALRPDPVKCPVDGRLCIAARCLTTRRCEETDVP